MSSFFANEGNLGRALLRYKGFAAQGFRIVAAFDADARVVGSTIEGISVHSLDRLPEIVRQRQIQIGMVTVPAPSFTVGATGVIE